MRLSRVLISAAILSLTAFLLPLSATEPGALSPGFTMTPSGEIKIANECPSLYYCPWYIDVGCTCELVWCFGRWECGVPYYGVTTGSTSVCSASAPALAQAEAG